MRTWIVAGLMVGAIGLAAAGCGGGSSSASGDETTVTETATATETTSTSGNSDEETDGSFAPTSAICKEVNNQGSPLNIAASTGDFESAADRWELLLPKVPAAEQANVKLLIEAFRLIDEDPAGFGVLDRPKYKNAQQAVNDFTAATCSNTG